MTPAELDLGGIAILVVAYRSTELLQQNLVPLTRAHPELAVHVVENRSTHAEREGIEALAAREGWHLEVMPANVGFGAGMNTAAAAALTAGSEFLLLLNPDATISAESIAELRDVVRADRLALVAPRILHPDGRVWFEGSDLYLRDGRVRSTANRRPGLDRFEWLTGACLLLHRTLWQAVGGFDDAYFLYWEDVDLSWKVVQHGGSVRVVRSATAVHSPGGTFQDSGQERSGSPKSDLYYYFNVRNRLVFAALRMPADRRRAWFVHTPAVLREVLLRGGRRQFLRSRSGIGAALAGWRDGVRIARAVRAHRAAPRLRRQERLSGSP